MTNKAPIPVAVAYGDGIGPEIMAAVLDIFQKSGARLDLKTVTLGKEAYDKGESNGVSAHDLKVMEGCKAVFKAPLETPQGGGYSSVNVAIRKRYDLFANIRPCVSYEPVLQTNATKADLVIVRENIEGMYIGIEHRPTPDTAAARKVFTQSETDRIVRFAYEYALANDRRKVTAMSKDNILKITDGMFHATFDGIGKEYPNIKQDFYIMDIGAARIASRTRDFDVVVTGNLYGDIISDIAADVIGSVGLNGSANIGENFAMFEAVGGTARDIAGKGIANPSGLLLAGVMMLNYIGQNDVAEKIHNAFLKALEDGIHTGDIANATTTTKRVGTKDFAQAVIERLGQKPVILKPVDYSQVKPGVQMPPAAAGAPPEEFVIEGIDVNVAHDGPAEDLANTVIPLLPAGASLKEILTARNDKVWPGKLDSFKTDLMTLRIMFKDAANKPEREKRELAVKILSDFTRAGGPDWVETRNLTHTKPAVAGAVPQKNYR